MRQNAGLWTNRRNRPENCLRTLRTESFQHIVHTLQAESIGQWNGWYLYLLQAERAVAVGTIEMGVFFLIALIVVTVLMADIVFQCTAAIIDGMDKSVEEEERERPRNRAFVDGWQQLLQPGQRQHLIATVQLLKDEQPRGGGFDVVMLQIVDK